MINLISNNENFNAELFTENGELKYNGEISVRSLKTGEHRTFRISNWKKADKRIISALTGPCNETDYLGIGFIEGSEVKTWSRHVNTQHEKNAKWVMKVLAAGGHESAEIFFSCTCRRCGRKLTHPNSIESGIGPECAKKV